MRVECDGGEYIDYTNMQSIDTIEQVVSKCVLPASFAFYIERYTSAKALRNIG